MTDLFIEPTNSTPLVDFKASGILNMEGRSLPEDSISFFNPVLNWLKDYQQVSTVLNFKLEYLNTASSKQVLALLKMIVDNPENRSIKINWYYEEGDLDGLETGEHFATILKEVSFEFIEYAETDI